MDLESQITRIQDGTFKKGAVPPLWDGKSTERIMDVINSII
jgi:hypothetical protein